MEYDRDAARHPIASEFDGYEWDERKSEICLQARAFDFSYAARIFEADIEPLDWEDTRDIYGEPRFVSVGEVASLIIAVVWTPRGNLRRIISARPASRRERKLFIEYRETQLERDP
uniref:Protein containing DUF497 n=1 Tax=mine drainage metagenome TaxID=410659 RepID=E6Q5X5_9ZZZZ